MARHGTRSSYVQGCRCDECRAANNAHGKEYRKKNKRPSRALRDKPLRTPNSPTSVSFDVPRSGKWIGSAVHFAGANWLCVYVLSDRKTLRLRRFQDGGEREALISECTRPKWWEG